MLSGDENETKPVKKSARKSKTDQDGKKAEPRKRKPTPRQDQQPEPSLEAADAINAPVAPPENSVTEAGFSEETALAEVAPAEADQGERAQAEQPLEAAESAGTEEVLVETVAIEAAPAESSAVVPVAAAEAAPVSYQTIADAYRKYTTESLDRTQTFFGRLAGVRSLDKAFELQSEFARQAYDGFVTESLKLRELHSQFAKQRMRQWEGFVARMMGPR